METKSISQANWEKKYTIKRYISLKAKHDWEALQPVEADSDLEKRTKGYKAMNFLLSTMVIEPKLNQTFLDSEDANGTELEELYQQLVDYYGLLPSLDEDDQAELLKIKDTEKRMEFIQEVALARQKDLKKKRIIL